MLAPAQFVKALFHFFAAIVRMKWAHLRGYVVVASPAMRALRKDLCDLCPENRDGECRKCGCFIEAKVSVNTEECPRGYWDRIWTKGDKVLGIDAPGKTDDCS